MDLTKFIHIVKCSARVIFVIITNLYCIPTYLIWMWVVFLPLRLLNHPSYWYIESIMYKWLLCMVASWSWEAQYYIMEIGDDITSYISERCLLLVNHQSTADVPMLMAAFQEKDRMLCSVMWIMDRMFRLTNFGIVSVTHGDYFITQGKKYRESQMKKLFRHLIDAYLVRKHQWIVLFPEGGFLSKRKETSVKYAKENGLPLLHHVTLPRIGAIHMILNTLHPTKLSQSLSEKCPPSLKGCEDEIQPLKWVVDVTIAYPDGHNPLDILAICSSSRPTCTTYIHYRCYPVETVPFEDVTQLQNWVYNRWVEKEQLLDTYYRTGKFSVSKCNQNCNNISEEVIIEKKHLVMQDNVWIGFLHLFFLSSSYLHYCLLRRFCSFTFG